MKKIKLTLQENHIRQIIFKHLNPKDYKVFLFGSRAQDTAGKWSDYDIGVKHKQGKKLSETVKEALKKELESSDIPYIIEIVDFATVSDKFKKVALDKKVLWN